MNENTWKKLVKPSLLTSRKVAGGVSGRKLHFLGVFACNISFMGQTEKAVVLKLKNTTNLIGTDGTALFDLWDLLINSFSKQVNRVTTSNMTAIENFKKTIKKKVPISFSKGLGTCTKKRNLKLLRMEHQYLDRKKVYL